MKIHDLLNVHVPTVAELALKHDVPVSVVQLELEKGIQVEQEHTTHVNVARQIALAHLDERLDYYDQLAKVDEDTTRTSKTGAPGTLKAKISRLYGGAVTCAKAQKLKTRSGATAHDKAQANWYQNMNCGGATQVDESQQVSVPEWPTNLAWKIQLKRFSNMDPLMDVRKDKVYLMPFVNWESTYYSLTNKDLHKVKFMPTQIYQVQPDALVGDMYLINQAHRTQDPTVRDHLLQQYKDSIVSYQQFLHNPLMFQMPEILATPTQIQLKPGKITSLWDKNDQILKLGISHTNKKIDALTEIFQEPAQSAVWTPYSSQGYTFWVTKFRFGSDRVEIEAHPDVHQSYAKYVFRRNNKDLNPQDKGWNVIFKVNASTDVTGAMGPKSATLFGKVVSMLKGFLQQHDWDYVYFSGEEGSRDRLYYSLAQRLADQVNGTMLHTGSDFLIHKSANLQEVFDPPQHKFKWSKQINGEWYSEFRVAQHLVEVVMLPENGYLVQGMFDNLGIDLGPHTQGYELRFSVDGTFKITGHMGTQSVKIFSWVVHAVADFLNTHDWDFIMFEGSEGSRNKLYATMTEKLAQKLGAKHMQDNGQFVIYKPQLQEHATGVGLVVPGVNMPTGMHPDEIRRQARKWGFKTTAQGVPPLLRSDGKLPK